MGNTCTYTKKKSFSIERGREGEGVMSQGREGGEMGDKAKCKFVNSLSPYPFPLFFSWKQSCEKKPWREKKTIVFHPAESRRLDG